MLKIVKYSPGIGEGMTVPHARKEALWDITEVGFSRDGVQ